MLSLNALVLPTAARLAFSNAANASLSQLADCHALSDVLNSTTAPLSIEHLALSDAENATILKIFEHLSPALEAIAQLLVVHLAFPIEANASIYSILAFFDYLVVGRATGINTQSASYVMFELAKEEKLIALYEDISIYAILFSVEPSLLLMLPTVGHLVTVYLAIDASDAVSADEGADIAIIHAVLYGKAVDDLTGDALIYVAENVQYIQNISCSNASTLENSPKFALYLATIENALDNERSSTISSELLNANHHAILDVPNVSMSKVSGKIIGDCATISENVALVSIRNVTAVVVAANTDAPANANTDAPADANAAIILVFVNIPMTAGTGYFNKLARLKAKLESIPKYGFSITKFDNASYNASLVALFNEEFNSTPLDMLSIALGEHRWCASATSMTLTLDSDDVVSEHDPGTAAMYFCTNNAGISVLRSYFGCNITNMSILVKHLRRSSTHRTYSIVTSHFLRHV